MKTIEYGYERDLLIEKVVELYASLGWSSSEKPQELKEVSGTLTP